MESSRVTRWNQEHSPTEEELRELMQHENLMPYAWSNGAGDEYPPHSHTYAKVIYVVAGSIT
jgi:quercetin dioxygenase-like cupin family protein